LVEKGYVKNFQEAFQKYLQDGGSCYVCGMKFSPKEVIEKIHQVQAKAVLAHPHVMPSQLVDTVLEYPFDGIEAYYARKLPIEEKKWVKIAEKRNLIITGGSDFHGLLLPHLSLGASWVNQDTFNRLAK
jgi:predicted metal-dependent phosphoesterase TrpH